MLVIKNKFLFNSIKTIKQGMKKNNLLKIKDMIKDIKNLKEMIDIIKILYNQPSKFQTVLELINRCNIIVDIIEKCKTKFNLIKVMSDEVIKYSKKISEKLLEEFLKESIDLSKTITFIGKDQSADLMLDVRKQTSENFDFSILKSSNIFVDSMKCIKFCKIEDEELFKKSKELLNFSFKIDLELCLRINPSIRKYNFDAFNLMNDKLNQIFFELTNSKIQNKPEIFKSLEQIDQNIYLFLITKIFVHSNQFTKFLMKIIQNELVLFMNKENFEKKKIEKYQNLYKSDLKKIRNICRDDLTKQLERIFYWNIEVSHKLGLNSFLKSLQFNKYCIKTLASKLVYLSTIFLKQEENFIIQFFSKKNQELSLLIENDDWKEVNIPSIYQIMLNFISNDNFSKIKNKFFSNIFEILDEAEKFEVINQDETSICIFNEKYKIISSMITVIKLFFDAQKLIFLCDNSLVSIIIQLLIRIIGEFTNKCCLMIIGGDLFKSKKIPVTQKHICIYDGVFLSSMMFFSTIVNQMKNIIINNFSSELNSFNEIELLISKLVYSGKQKILEISLECINQSFLIYPQIDWIKEPSADVKEKANKFFKQISNLSQVYTSMINFIPMSVVQEQLITICNNLIECFSKQLNLLPKIELKANAREFRLLMKNIKKLIEFFKINNPTYYLDKIDEFIATKAPQKKNEKKEKEDE